MGAESDVGDRVAVEAACLRPRPGLAGAVLAQADRERPLGVREDDVDDLPVPLVRLPDRAQRQERIAVEVVVVEEPVLEDDAVLVPGEAPVDGDAGLVGGRRPRSRGGRPAARRRSRRAGSGARRAGWLPAGRPRRGSGSTTTHVVGLVAASRLESLTNDSTVVGRSSSPGWKTSTGWNFVSSFATPPDAWAGPAAARHASSAIARTRRCRRDLIAPPSIFVPDATRARRGNGSGPLNVADRADRERDAGGDLEGGEEAAARDQQRSRPAPRGTSVAARTAASASGERSYRLDLDVVAAGGDRERDHPGREEQRGRRRGPRPPSSPASSGSAPGRARTRAGRLRARARARRRAGSSRG